MGLGRIRFSTPRRPIRALGGADVVAPKAFERAFASLNRGGRLVCLALPAEGEISIPIFDTVLKGIEIIGSIVGTRQDLAEVFDLHARGRTIDQVNEAVAEVLSGRVTARLVFEY